MKRSHNGQSKSSAAGGGNSSSFVDSFVESFACSCGRVSCDYNQKQQQHFGIDHDKLVEKSNCSCHMRVSSSSSSSNLNPEELHDQSQPFKQRKTKEKPYQINPAALKFNFEYNGINRKSNSNSSMAGGSVAGKTRKYSQLQPFRIDWTGALYSETDTLMSLMDIQYTVYIPHEQRGRSEVRPKVYPRYLNMVNKAVKQKSLNDGREKLRFVGGTHEQEEEESEYERFVHFMHHMFHSEMANSGNSSSGSGSVTGSSSQSHSQSQDEETNTSNNTTTGEQRPSTDGNTNENGMGSRRSGTSSEEGESESGERREGLVDTDLMRLFMLFTEYCNFHNRHPYEVMMQNNMMQHMFGNDAFGMHLAQLAAAEMFGNDNESNETANDEVD